MVHFNAAKFFTPYFGKRMVKHCTVFCLIWLCFPSAYLFAQTTCTIKAYCTIPAKGSNTVEVKATFSNAIGKISFDPDNLWGSFFDINLDATSLSSGTEKNDAILKSEGFFNAQSYPEIKFTSTGIYCDSATKSKIYHIGGNLTVKNITHPVTIDFYMHHSSGFTILVGKYKLDAKTWHIKAPTGIANETSINIEATVQ